MSLPSINRLEQYRELSCVELHGTILDLGGSRTSGYHELIKGDHSFTVVNYGSQHPGADLLFDIEKKFPLENESYDNVISINVIEHIFDTHNVFSETSRVLKSGGLFVSTIPYMHHIHGSPDDYVRYTSSAYKKFAEKYNFEIIEMKEIGFGLFSLIFQTITSRNIFRYSFIYNFFRILFTSIDQILLNFNFYKKFSKNIPLGYFWIMKKK